MTYKPLASKGIQSGIITCYNHLRHCCRDGNLEGNLKSANDILENLINTKATNSQSFFIFSGKKMSGYVEELSRFSRQIQNGEYFPEELQEYLSERISEIALL